MYVTEQSNAVEFEKLGTSCEKLFCKCRKANTAETKKEGLAAK